MPRPGIRRTLTANRTVLAMLILIVFVWAGCGMGAHGSYGLTVRHPPVQGEDLQWLLPPEAEFGGIAAGLGLPPVEG
jgi:hypothetical protein